MADGFPGYKKIVKEEKIKKKKHHHHKKQKGQFNDTLKSS